MVALTADAPADALLVARACRGDADAYSLLVAARLPGRVEP